jgi:DNA-binding transcriptional LysR family regulator
MTLPFALRWSVETGRLLPAFQSLKLYDRMRAIRLMNFNALDLNLLKVFDALMRERSVTRAASRLNLSQPAVSSALNRLRRQLDDQLFLRQSNQMVPTARALALWEVLRHSLDGIKAAMAEAEPFDAAACRRHIALAEQAFTEADPRTPGWVGRLRVGPRVRPRSRGRPPSSEHRRT